MNSSLAMEINWLVMTIVMTSLFWVPYIINRMQEQGVLNAVWDQEGVTGTDRRWAERMMDAHQNAVENLIIFAPLVILIQLTGLNSEITATACMIYFFARLVHYVVFTFAVPVLRVVSFLMGFGAQCALALVLLGLI